MYVPQVVGPGVDVGHVVLVVENLDGTHGTLGFYPSSLTLGLRSVAGEEAVVVTPDPLYAKALTSRDGRLAAKVQPLYRGVLSAEQAAKLNAWSDALVLTTRVGRTGELRERGTATFSDLRYQPLGVSGHELRHVSAAALWARRSSARPGCRGSASRCWPRRGREADAAR